MAAKNPQLAVKIVANTAELITSLEAGRGAIEKYGPTVAKMQEDWNRNSAKIVEQAAKVTAAMQGIEVKTLSAADSSKALRQLETAMSQLERSGQPIPGQFTALAQKLRDAQAPAQGFGDKIQAAWSKIQGFAGVLGIGMGIGAVVSFGKSVFDTASNIGDLSSKLGTSTEFTQRMQYVASQSGTTIDAFGTAISKMNANLSKGESSTIEVLKKTGLSFTQIRAMKPEDAFYAISEAIRRIPDPMLQAEAAVRLFGKSGQDLLPAIKDGIREVGDRTKVMSSETVEKLKAAQDAWEGFKNRALILTGEALVSVAGHWQVLAFALGAAAATQIPALIAAVESLNVGMGLLAANPVVAAFIAIGAAALVLSHELDQGTSAMRRNIQASSDAKLVRDLWNSSTPLTIKQQDELKAALDRQSGAIKGVAKGTYDMSSGLSLTIGPTVSLGNESAKTSKAVDAHAQKIRDLADTYTGKKLAEQIRDTAEAFKLATKEGGLNKGQTEELTKALDGYLRQGGLLPPMLLSFWAAHQNFNAHVVPPTVAGFQKLTESVTKYGAKVQQTIPPLAPIVSASIADLLRSTSVSLDAIAVAIPAKFKVSFQDVLAGASAFANGIGGKFGKIANFAINAASQIQGMASAFMKGDWIGGSIAALGLLGSTIGKIFSHDGRKAVEDYVATFGGFDAFHKMLGEKLPADSERFWIALTQGVGKNDPEAAKRIIAEINTALAKQSEQEAATAQAAKDAAEKQTTALQAVKDKIQSQITDLDQARQSLMDSISNEAPEEVMGIVESQARAQIEAIDAQTAALQKQMDNTSDAGTVAVSVIKNAAREAYQQIKDEWSAGLHIPVWYDQQGGPDPNYAAGGGLVTSAGVQYLASGGVTQAMGRLLSFKPRGTDTVPAMLTPGEGVVNRRGMAALGAGGLRALNSGTSAPSLDLSPLSSELRQLRGDLKRQSRDLPHQIARVVADRLAKVS